MQKCAVERVNLADGRVAGRSRSVDGARFAIPCLRHDRHGQIRLQAVLHADRAAAGATAAMRRAERLVQVEVHHVEAHIAGPRDAEHRVHVRAVAVDQPARRVDQLADLLNVALEEPNRIRIGQHKRRNVSIQRLFQRLRSVQPRLLEGMPFTLKPHRARWPGSCRAPSRESRRYCDALRRAPRGTP